MNYPPRPGRRPLYPPSGMPPWPLYPNPGYSPQPPYRPAGYGPTYGRADAGPLPGGYPFGPARRSRKRLWFTLAVVAAGVLAAAGWMVVGPAGESDQAKITRTIDQFAEAVDTGDMPGALSYLCAAEAQQITGDEDRGIDDTGTVDPGKRLPVNVSDIQITGDSATARLSRPPAESRILRLQKDAGTWKLCNPGPVERTNPSR